MSRKYQGPVPTLAHLRRIACWLWVHCGSVGSCLHRTPVALAPVLIRWGADASSDVLRRSAPCSRCGSKAPRSRSRVGEAWTSAWRPSPWIYVGVQLPLVAAAPEQDTTI